MITTDLNSIFDLTSRKVEDLEAIPEIGPIVALNVYRYFQDAENIKMLRQLEAAGVNMINEGRPKVEADAGHPLFGKTILFTGTLHKMTRDEAQEIAEKKGARNLSGVSRNLHYLVVGDNAGSKLTKAKALGSVEILTEDEFLAMISQ